MKYLIIYFITATLNDFFAFPTKWLRPEPKLLFSKFNKNQRTSNKVLVPYKSTLLTLFSTFSDDKVNNRVAKSIVSLLTYVSNMFSRTESMSTVVKNEFYKNVFVNPDIVFDGILNDFKTGYLFSGSIEKEVYHLNCTFTDPTLSFQGLTVFLKNVASVKPLADYFLGEKIVVLYWLKHFNSNQDNKLDSNSRIIEATWRMSSEVKFLPWSPRIELPGQTRYTYLPIDKSNIETLDGRIIDYYETWYLPALDVLKQLLTPSALSNLSYNSFVNEYRNSIKSISFTISTNTTKPVYLDKIIYPSSSLLSPSLSTTTTTTCLDVNIIKNSLMNIEFLNLEISSNIDTTVVVSSLYHNILDLYYIWKLGMFPINSHQEFIRDMSDSEITNDYRLLYELNLQTTMYMEDSFLYGDNDILIINKLSGSQQNQSNSTSNYDHRIAVWVKLPKLETI